MNPCRLALFSSIHPKIPDFRYMIVDNCSFLRILCEFTGKQFSNHLSVLGIKNPHQLLDVQVWEWCAGPSAQSQGAICVGGAQSAGH